MKSETNERQEAIKYFCVQRQRFFEKAGGQEELYTKEIKYCDIAISAMEQAAKEEKKKADIDRKSEDFEKFWAAYPLKKGKPTAVRAFNKIAPDNKLLVQIIAAVEQDKCSNRWIADDGKYIPHPATWLNDRRYESYEGDAQSDNDVDFIAMGMLQVPKFNGG